MNYAIEILRIVSTFFIVAYHTNPICGKLFFYGGLIFFICTAIYMNASKSDVDTYSVIKKSFHRLFVPWLLWSLIFAVGNYINRGCFFCVKNFDFLTAVRGPQVHLWYLPFIFIVLIFGKLFIDKIEKFKLLIICIFMYATMMLTVDLWRPISLRMTEPLPQYFHALPAVFAGFAIVNSSKRFIKFCSLILLILTSFSSTFKGVLIPYITGLFIFCFAINFPYLPKKNITFIDFFSRQSMGIYLIHPIYIHLLSNQKNNLDYFFPIIVYLVSLLTILFFKKFVPFSNKFC